MSKQTNMWLDDETRKALDRARKVTGLSIRDIVVTLVRIFLPQWLKQYDRGGHE